MTDDDVKVLQDRAREMGRDDLADWLERYLRVVPGQALYVNESGYLTTERHPTVIGFIEGPGAQSANVRGAVDGLVGTYILDQT